ncbi:anaphase-promoting complex subunit 5 isoform X2 [Phymastichus coffea]|uniref:anaphase-promoting complex subunit 5 isoform X2 n=1 Tax=Phymastichus coffea TaxID=108790 RepID=UPI00273C70F0|nr:anaphase-promoting complex subunit 5 isoform X2 [Phymastichus coffea]
MHFWIDKPAGRYYGFSGRRYPAMSFPKTHFSNHRRCGNALDAHRLHMVTPVHRFQTVNSSANSAGPSASNSSRCSRQGTNNSNRNLSNNSGLSPGQENSNNNVNNSNNNQQALPQSTSATNRGLLNFSEFSDAEMAGYRLRCSVWIIFILATGFVAAARFYFDHQQGAGLEVLVFCGLLATLLMSGCFYSVTCRRAQNSHHQEVQAEPIATVTVANPNSNESNRQVLMPIRQNPPPPYHIAILIPPPISPEETPPPAYDKIMQ